MFSPSLPFSPLLSRAVTLPQVRVVDSVSMETQWIVKGLALAHHDTRLAMAASAKKVNGGHSGRSGVAIAPTGLVSEPRSGLLVVNGAKNSGTIQFFDPERDLHISELDVARRNVISRVDYERVPSTQVRGEGRRGEEKRGGEERVRSVVACVVILTIEHISFLRLLPVSCRWNT